MFKSLRFRLSIIFISLAVVPIVLAVIFLTRYSVVYLEKQSQSILHEIAIGVRNEVRAFVEDHKDHLFQIHKLHGFELLNPEKKRIILSSLLFDQLVYQELVLLSPEGQEVFRLSRSNVFLGKDLKSRATQKEFLFPATHKKAYFSPVYFDKKIQEPLITISIPLVDLRNEKLANILVANVRFRKIWDLLGNIEIPGDGVVYVVDQAKQVVAHRNPSVVLRGTTVNLPEVSGRAKGLSGTDVMIHWDFLQLGDQKMAIVAEQPISHAFALIAKTFRIAITVTTVVLVLAIILILLAIQRIVKPVERMATAARAVSKGDYTQRTEVTSQDEIGALASAFNQMRQDLAKYHNKMEELVKIRTEELAEANKQLKQEIVDRRAMEKERKRLIKELQLSLEKVKMLSGLLPICSSCKKIRDDRGYWNQIESYIGDHSEAEFTHSYCPECTKKIKSELEKAIFANKKD